MIVANTGSTGESGLWTSPLVADDRTTTRDGSGATGPVLPRR
ncbi:hypothetical protein [Salinirubrum litoreum]|nr:hypothetical protein [Salinirubrum litoreum]